MNKELIDLLIKLTVEDGITVSFMNSEAFHGVMEIRMIKSGFGDDKFKIIRGIDPSYDLRDLYLPGRLKMPIETVLITKLKEMREDLLKMEECKRRNNDKPRKACDNNS